MRRLALQMQVSVDGFVAGPNGELDWVFRSLGDDATAWIVERLWQAGVHIMGRRTYHDMAAHWPTSTEPYAAPMNQIPKVVFSRKGVLEPAGAATARALEDASRNREARGGRSASAVSSVVEEWARSRVAGGELAEEIARLKRESGKEILAHGGASFAQSLAQSGLVDEYRLVVHPVVLGRGLPLFSGLSGPLDLQLVSATPFASGTVAQVYRTAATRGASS
jgi:dihydrofolate reductase